MTTTPSNVPAVPDLVFTDSERLALAGFLAGHRGLTRDAYALDLRQSLSFCEGHGLKLFSVRRTDIELYARALQEAGRARATVARRLLHRRQLLPLRRGGGASAHLPGGPCPPSAPGL